MRTIMSDFNIQINKGKNGKFIGGIDLGGMHDRGEQQTKLLIENCNVDYIL